MWSGTVAQFIQFAQSARLTDAIRRSFVLSGNSVLPYEEKSWDKSLPALAKVLQHQGLNSHQIHIMAEVAMPGSSSRADVVLLGQNEQGGRGAVILELKQWRKAEGAKAEYVTWGNDTYLKLHPCAQVQGYRDYLRLYAAALVDRDPISTVQGVAFLHNMADVTPLAEGWGSDAAVANQDLVADCPAFGHDDGPAMASYIRRHLPAPPRVAYVTEFARLEKRASKALMQSFKAIIDSHQNPWVLLDFQRDAMDQIEEALVALHAGTAPDRQVIVVSGGPGSGKTVIALTTLMKAFANYGLARTYLVATSSAQRHAIAGEISLATREKPPPTRKVSRAPVLKAIELRVKAPGLVTGFKNSDMTRAEWQTHCEEWRAHHEPHVGDPIYDVVIVDEAQGLVMPNKPHVDGSQANAWRRPYGPQPWHIIMQSRLGIFLMDADQGYRQVESSTPEDIAACAQLEGIKSQHLSLGNEQFRVAGGAAYVAWLDHLFGFTPQPPPQPTVSERDKLVQIFGIAEDPGRMRDRLWSLHEEGANARLLAGYAWKWVSKNSPTAIDSHEGLTVAGRMPPPNLAFRWAPGGEDGQRAYNLGLSPYDHPEALFGRDSTDPATAGYPLTVRGRDMDHVGVLWGRDLVWRTDHWVVDHRLVFGSDMPGLRKAAREEVKAGVINGPAMQTLVKAVAGGYRILLTRGMESVRVWIEDEETAAYVGAAWSDFIAGGPASEDGEG